MLNPHKSKGILHSSYFQHPVKSFIVIFQRNPHFNFATRKKEKTCKTHLVIKTINKTKLNLCQNKHNKKLAKINKNNNQNTQQLKTKKIIQLFKPVATNKI